MLGWNLYFITALISGSQTFRFTGSVSLHWGILRVVMILQKNSFKTDAVFLTFSTTATDLGGCARGASPPPKFWAAKRFYNFYYALGAICLNNVIASKHISSFAVLLCFLFNLSKRIGILLKIHFKHLSLLKLILPLAKNQIVCKECL